MLTTTDPSGFDLASTFPANAGLTNPSLPASKQSPRYPHLNSAAILGPQSLPIVVAPISILVILFCSTIWETTDVNFTGS